VEKRKYAVYIHVRQYSVNPRFVLVQQRLIEPSRGGTMFLECHFRSWLMLDPFLPTLSVDLANFVSVVPFHPLRRQLVRDFATPLEYIDILLR
jgi:hypothetical protein